MTHTKTTQDTRETEKSNGFLSLCFAQDALGQTRLTDRSWRPPLQVVRDFTQSDKSCLVHQHNVSGGILGGDKTSTEIVIGENANVQLTTTSGTRIYRSKDGNAAQQSVNVRAGKDSLLEYLPDPLIPYAQSIYHQDTNIELNHGAGLFWWETVYPGRTAYGESLAYTELKLNCDIKSSDHVPILRERLCIMPAINDIRSCARMHRYTYMTSFYICRIGEPSHRWQELESLLMQQCEEKSNSNYQWGTSTLTAHGLLIRGLSTEPKQIYPGLLAFWKTAKNYLYDCDPIPPRKIY